MIHSMYLSCRDNDDVIYEPPTHVLDLAVIGTDAHLQIVDMNPDGTPIRPVRASVRVPARSLLLALQAAIADETTSEGQHPQQPG